MISQRWHTIVRMLVIVFFGAFSVAHAASGTALTLEKVVTLITDVINILMGLAVTVTVGILVYGGFQMVYSRGNDAEFKKGKDTIHNAAIGLAVILGVGIIINTIADFAVDPTSITR